MAALAFIILGNMMQQNPDWGNGVVEAGDAFVFFGWVVLLITVIVWIIAAVADR